MWGVKLGLLILDWRKTLCFVIVPQLIANLGIVGINFLWHDGCDPEHPVNHSRNFTGPLLNFLALNNGDHGMHHEEPELHWSLLPEAHARHIRPGLHSALEQPSLAGYLWRTFVYPGRRETFDGKPITFRANDGDLDWVEQDRATREPRDHAHQRVSGSVGEPACRPGKASDRFAGDRPRSATPHDPNAALRGLSCERRASANRPSLRGALPLPPSVSAKHFPESDWSFLLAGAMVRPPWQTPSRLWWPSKRTGGRW